MNSARSLLPRARFLRRLRDSILVSPLLLAVLLASSFVSFGQFKEILIRVSEPGEEGRLLLGFAAMALLSTTLFFGYLSACVVLRQTGIGYGSSLFYNSSDELEADRWVARIRDAIALLCALLPLALIGWAFLKIGGQVEANERLFQAAALKAGLESAAPAASGGLTDRMELIAYWWWVLSAAVLIVLWGYARRAAAPGGGLLKRSTRTHMPRSIMWLSLLMLLLPIPLLELGRPPMGDSSVGRTIASLFHLDWAPHFYDETFRAIGPLAALGLSLTCLAYWLFRTGELSRRRGVPIFLVVALFVFGYGIARWVSAENPALEAKGIVASRDKSSEVTAQFSSWLRSRPDINDFANREDGYPVFLVAAPGGGIYAAAFAASVLAELQDNCTNFAGHVFAISAVSGGAIGSTIFTATAPNEPSSEAEVSPCHPEGRFYGPRLKLVSRVMADDQFSPMLGATVPDLAVKLGQIAFYELKRFVWENPSFSYIAGRAEALETSFKRSMDRACENPKGKSLCREHAGVDTVLDMSFDHHWSPEFRAPALVLNTTWAETGFRVTFAPFVLEGVGNTTLKNYTELEAGGRGLSLIEAAVASARFPASLPAKILNPKAKAESWWNLVDGGYADASGATTALEIYKALDGARDAIRDETGIKFDLKLLILTDAPPDIDVNKLSGDGLVHAITPITTLLNIRQQIGRRAVARAEAELKEIEARRDEERKKRDEELRASAASSARPENKSCAGGSWAVKRIVLDADGFSIPLGWLLSRRTENLLQRLVGSPVTPNPVDAAERIDQLLREGSEEERKKEWEKMLRASKQLMENSQTMLSIKTLLAGGCPSNFYPKQIQ